MTENDGKTHKIIRVKMSDAELFEVRNRERTDENNKLLSIMAKALGFNHPWQVCSLSFD